MSGDFFTLNVADWLPWFDELWDMIQLNGLLGVVAIVVVGMFLTSFVLLILRAGSGGK